jgi:hypothetical protein
LYIRSNMMKTFDIYDKFDCRCTSDEVGKAWEYRWGIADAEAGLCPHSDVGTSRPTDPNAPPPAPVTHPLTAGIDLDHPDADRTILRRLYHKDPQAFLDAYGTAGINKLMDLAAKEGPSQPYPAVTDSAAWTKLMADIAKEVQKADVATVATPAILLMMLHMKEGKLYGLGELLRRT